MKNSKELVVLIVATVFSFIFLFGLGEAFSTKYSYLFQYYKNLSANDNRLNFANHNYGHNLMRSAEPHAIFMTEGGDNQVFSLLYFAKVEKKRLDVDFFDQKGNVFPRLYGDLFSTYHEDLELLRDIRDFQLYSTGRPVYLTWRRPDLEKLNLLHIQEKKRKLLEKASPSRKRYLDQRFDVRSWSALKATARSMVPSSVYDLKLRSGGYLYEQDFRYLGPWYLQTYGIVYRVTPLRYAISEALEKQGGRGTYNSIRPYVLGVSKLSLSEAQYNYYVRQLVQEDYLRVLAGGVVELKKPFRPVFGLGQMDYWNGYVMNYQTAPFAPNWDLLSRNIMGGYNLALSDAHGGARHYVVQQAQAAQSEGERQALLSRAKFHEAERLKALARLPIYNYDAPNLVFYYARTLLDNKEYDKAILLLASIPTYAYRYTQPYLQASYLLLQKAEKAPGGALAALLEAEGYLDQFFEKKRFYFNSIGNPGGMNADAEVQEAENLLRQLRVLKERAQETASATAQAPPASAKPAAEAPSKEETERQLKADTLLKAVQLYEAQKNTKKVVEVYNQIFALKPNDLAPYLKLYAFAKENNPPLAIEVLRLVLRNYQQFGKPAETKEELFFFLGEALLASVDDLLTANKTAQAKAALAESKVLLDLFIDTSRSRAALERRQQVTAAKAALRRAKALLQQLE